MSTIDNHHDRTLSGNLFVHLAISSQSTKYQYVGRSFQRLSNWHINCSTPHRLQVIDKEGQMESLIDADSHDIQYEKETFRAAVCNRCGARMFPTELLEAHLDRHELKDLFLQSELKKLQFAMNRMR